MNIKKYYLYRFFSELMPIYTLYLLMFEQNGLSLGQISALLAIWSVPALLLEIPSGVLADHWSRKNLMLIGSSLKAGCYMIWLFSQSFVFIAIGFLLWGIGGSLCSGAEEALLFDTLKIEQREDDFDRIYGKGRFLSGISTIIASLTGGYLGMRFGFNLALSISVLMALSSGVIVASMREVNLYRQDRVQEESKLRKNTLYYSIQFLLGRKDIFTFVLLSLLVITTAGVLDEYDQLIAKEFGLTIALIGGWSAIRFLLISCGGVLAYRIRRRFEKIFGSTDRMLPIAFLCLIAAGFLVVSGIVRVLLVMVLYGLYYFIMAVTDVMQEDYIQQKIASEGRSTVHSIIALSQNLYGMICYGLFGLVASHSELFTGLACTGGYIALWTITISVLYLIWKKREIAVSSKNRKD